MNREEMIQEMSEVIRRAEADAMARGLRGDDLHRAFATAVVEAIEAGVRTALREVCRGQ